jgi:hypothetical protein
MPDTELVGVNDLLTSEASGEVDEFAGKSDILNKFYK